MEEVTMSGGGLIMLCITCCGIGACIAHWAEVRFGRKDREDGKCER